MSETGCGSGVIHTIPYHTIPYIIPYPNPNPGHPTPNPGHPDPNTIPAGVIVRGGISQPTAIKGRLGFPGSLG